MIPQQDLLAERARLLQELAAIEVLLARGGWVRDAQPSAPVEYAKEFRQMVAALDFPDFTLNDFRNHLLKSHPAEALNTNSMRTPIKTELEAGSIVLVKEGSGRRG